MEVAGFTRWSGSRKTLLVRLLPAMDVRGPSVSTVEHAHHGLDVDRLGEDTCEDRCGSTS